MKAFLNKYVLLGLMAFLALAVSAKAGVRKPQMIEFYSLECQSCRAIAPMINKVEKQYGDRVTVVKLDIDDPNNERYVQSFGIGLVPTLVFVAPNGDCTISNDSSPDGVKWGLKTILAQGGEQ